LQLDLFEQPALYYRLVRLFSPSLRPYTNIESTFERLLDLGATELEPVVDVGEGIKVASVR